MHLARTLCPFILLLGSACGGGGPVLPPGNGGTINVDPNRDGGVDVDPDGSDPTDPDGGTSTPTDGGDAGTEPDGGPSDEASPPTLDALEATQAGRDGQDVFLSLEGGDPNGDVMSFVLRFLDGGGAELMVVDTDLDGRADSGYMILGPEVSLDGELSFTATVIIEDLYARFPEIASIEAFALDAVGLASDPVMSTLAVQPVAALGDGCDDAYVTNRCAEGLGCAGEPAVCVDGSDPTLSDFGYFTTSDGYRIRMRGADPDDDVWRILLEFLDSGGSPVMLDLDNDGNPDSDTFEVDATGRSVDGSFFVEIEPTQTFTDQVRQLAATPYDSRQRAGNRMTAGLTRPPTRRIGQACDPQGFDECRVGDICYPGIMGAQNRCSAIEGQRQRACNDAPLLNPALGILRAVGVTGGVSMWDAPEGCAALDPKGRPEGVVMLDLPDGAQTVTLTTNLPGTGFDTVVYLVDGCAQDRDPVLGCHDNAPSTIASELVVRDLPVGRYLVVVDSWNVFGGAFEIEAIVEP